MEFGYGRKRGIPDGTFNGNGGFKRSKQETESFSTGIGSKSKPCTKFFSTTGCPFGEGCHFLHYVPGGINAVAKMTNMGGGNPAPPPYSRNPMVHQQAMPPNDSPPPTKSRICKKFNTAEGCKFGDKCYFSHEIDMGRQVAPMHNDPRDMFPMGGRFSGRMEPPPPGSGASASFGASATAKISVDASLAGGIIGKGGVNSKQICRVTGAKLSIRDHESDPNLKNIELEGTFDQIKQASAMVRELLMNISSSAAVMNKPPPQASRHHSSANNYKTKLCENYENGSCTFGEKCHFAHGVSELRKSGI